MFHLHLESPFSDVLTITRAKRNCQQRQGNIDEFLLDMRSFAAQKNYAN